MLFDFWVIHDRKYDSLAMYQPDSIYRYRDGFNWRAIVAFIVGVAPNLPGFINSINTDVKVGAGVHPYQFGWLLGFVGTSIVYLAVSIPKRIRAEETFIDKAVLPDEVYDANGFVDGEEVDQDELNPGIEKGGFKSKMDRFL